jgi:hypothetical protein
MRFGEHFIHWCAPHHHHFPYMRQQTSLVIVQAFGKPKPTASIEQTTANNNHDSRAFLTAALMSEASPHESGSSK